MRVEGREEQDHFPLLSKPSFLSLLKWSPHHPSQTHVHILLLAYSSMLSNETTGLMWFKAGRGLVSTKKETRTPFLWGSEIWNLVMKLQKSLLKWICGTRTVSVSISPQLDLKWRECGNSYMWWWRGLPWFLTLCSDPASACHLLISWFFVTYLFEHHFP